MHNPFINLNPKYSTISLNSHEKFDNSALANSVLVPFLIIFFGSGTLILISYFIYLYFKH
uniref:Uncharacterized protein n=1 Tax=viral metagenome TaxID=1070528 RepID=A0A6C0HNA3_9ZZZZ